MRHLLYLLPLALAGCVHPPDRVIVSYQQDPDDPHDRKAGVAFSFPITYQPAYRPLYEPPPR